MPFSWCSRCLVAWSCQLYPDARTCEPAEMDGTQKQNINTDLLCTKTSSILVFYSSTDIFIYSCQANLWYLLPGSWSQSIYLHLGLLASSQEGRCQDTESSFSFCFLLKWTRTTSSILHCVLPTAVEDLWDRWRLRTDKRYPWIYISTLLLSRFSWTTPGRKQDADFEMDPDNGHSQSIALWNRWQGTDHTLVSECWQGCDQSPRLHLGGV